jgi:hypothetical protein
MNVETIPGVNYLKSKLQPTLETSIDPNRIARRRIRNLKKIADNSGTTNVGFVVGPIADPNPIRVATNCLELIKTAKEAKKTLGLPVAHPVDGATILQGLRRLRWEKNGIADAVAIQRPVLLEGTISYLIPTSRAMESATVRDDIITAERSPEIEIVNFNS